MMRKLVFATNNIHKLREVKSLLPDWNILSLQDIGCRTDIPETQNTIEGNALQKAQYVYDKYGLNCFADDTGLLVDALDGAPGVYSARYAGEPANAQKNLNKLMQKLRGKTNRQAHFKTVIALILNGKNYTFEGICQGRITTKAKGQKGFGYDPVFQPVGYEKTFAEMSQVEKGVISHRGQAVRKLIEFLNKNEHRK